MNESDTIVEEAIDDETTLEEGEKPYKTKRNPINMAKT